MNRLKRIELLVHDWARVRYMRVEKPAIGSGGVDNSRNALTSADNVGNGADAGPSSA